MPEPLDAEFFCAGCRTPFVSAYALDERGLCAVCCEGLANFDSAYSFGSYEGSLQKLIQIFKYGKVETLARPLGEFLIRAVPCDERFDLIIAMPMHWRKKWERGFNQAELLARPVAKRYGLPLSTNLRRKRYTKSQAGLSEAERQSNLAGAFVVEDPSRLAAQHILLIDDVFTTGATLRAAASVLKRAGAARVSALTLARADRAFDNRGRAPVDQNAGHLAYAGAGGS